MKWRFAFSLFISFLLTNPASASEKTTDQICSGDARLDQLEGHWADTRLVNALKRGASWTDALRGVNSGSQAFDIQKRNVLLVLNWHEGDSYDGQKCLIKKTPASLVCRKGCWQEDKGAGEYIKLTLSNDHSAAYANLIFGNRCYLSNHNERWCINSTRISIHGQTSKFSVHLDTVELPSYGTPLKITNSRILPNNNEIPSLPVFVRTKKGFDIYDEDFVTTENYVRANSTKPWRRLVQIK